MPDNLPERLWRNNWLNIRKSTEVAKTRSPTKMYIAIELANTVIDTSGNVFPFALETLNYIKTGKHFHSIISTFYPDDYVTKIMRTYNIKCDWVNTNPHFQTISKPFYDCYIDAAAGFHASEWLYVLEMLKLSEKELDPSHIKMNI